jgi:hypothetical protein
LCWPGLYLRLGRVNKLINMLFELGVSSPAQNFVYQVAPEVAIGDNIPT